jgi:5-methylcytosine-specific restriction protein A
MAAANPTWTRDELILALDLYTRHRQGPLPDRDGPEVGTLSKLLIGLGAKLGFESDTYRNANGVYMKLANFRSLDPLFISQGLKGLPRGGKGDAEVWNEFGGNPDALKRVANAIRGAVLANGSDALAIISDVPDAAEGRLLACMHVSRERNRKLVAAKKQEAIKLHGTLACEACEFEFAKVYGDRGKDFIEAHHVRPLHSLRPGSRTHLSDLALVCSNCHSMIHARKQWLTLAALRDLLKGQP